MCGTFDQKLILSLCLSVCLPVCLSVIYLSLYLFVHISICMPVYLFISLSVCLFVYLSICLSGYDNLHIYLSVCLSVYLPAYLSVWGLDQGTFNTQGAVSGKIKICRPAIRLWHCFPFSSPYPLQIYSSQCMDGWKQRPINTVLFFRTA